jgi:2-amino-4-hydroxy-6-hydroxymethyldihydropteridine diphosphokinase
MPDAETVVARNRALLLLGSNIEPELNLPEAVLEIAGYGTIDAVSSVWESPPFGYAEQANFLNAALSLDTGLSICELKMQAIAACEMRLGRVRSGNKNAPRTIDIDIIFFNNEIYISEEMRIPDPDALKRPFVAIPLAEIAPDYIHPETGESLRIIAARFDLEKTGMLRRPDIILTSSLHNIYYAELQLK